MVDFHQEKYMLRISEPNYVQLCMRHVYQCFDQARTTRVGKLASYRNRITIKTDVNGSFLHFTVY